MIFFYFLLFDGAFLYSYRLEQNLCKPSNWHVTILQSTFFLPQSQSQLISLLFQSFLLINALLEICISIFSIGVSYDLIKTVRNPIDSYHKRLRNIFWWSAGVSFSFTAVMGLFIYVLPKSYFDLVDNLIFIKRPLLLVLDFIEMYFGVLAIFVSFRGIYQRKGPNSHIIKHIFQRQLLMVIIRLATQIPKNVLVMTNLRSQIVEKV